MRKELWIALENGDLDKIKILHEQKSLMSEHTFQGDNALHIAAREGHKQIVEWMHGLNESLESSLANVQNNDHNTPLHEAARNGDADLVETLLQRNQSCASHRNKFGETPLIIACKHGHRDAVIKLLGAYNYTTETQESYGRVSTSNSHTHQSDSQTSNKGGETSLLYAAVQGGSVEIVGQILDHGTWHDDLMTKQDKSGRCAIHVAAMHGRWDIITTFISKRPDSVEIRSSDHKSVLHFAVQYNQFEVVKNLLKDKNDFKKKKMVSGDRDDSHNTALHLAAKCPVDLELLNLLLLEGVDVDAQNDDGMTALDIASLAVRDNPDYLKTVKKLKRAGTMHTIHISNRIPDDIVNAHMVVASLIATVTFAAVFQIPGGIEDDRNSIQYGAAKMAFSKLFRLFVFSDTAAFMTSLSVVVIWLIKRHWQETPLATLIPHELSDISEVNLLISVCWTVVAFVAATIIVIVPHHYDKLESKENEAFKKYQSFWIFEIGLAVIVPDLAVYLYVFPYLLARTLRKANRWREAFKRLGSWIKREFRRGLSREPGISRILFYQFFVTTVLILSISFL